MDGLTFGSNILLRHMTFSEARWECQIYVVIKVKQNMLRLSNVALSFICSVNNKNFLK